MGIWYSHFISTNDPGWLPEDDTMLRVEATLRAWELVSAPTIVYDLNGGRPVEAGANRRAQHPGGGLLVDYGEVAGPAVERVMGASFYDNVKPDQRYLSKVCVLAGNDFRIPLDVYGTCFKVVKAPNYRGTEVKPFDESLYLPQMPRMYAEAYPAHRGTSPPVVEVRREEGVPVPTAQLDHLGYWRGALLLDCNKDLPKFPVSQTGLTNRDFVEAIAEAFRADLAECGLVD